MAEQQAIDLVEAWRMVRNQRWSTLLLLPITLFICWLGCILAAWGFAVLIEQKVPFTWFEGGTRFFCLALGIGMVALGALATIGATAVGLGAD